MSHLDHAPNDLVRICVGLGPRTMPLIGVGLAFAVGGYFAPAPLWRLILLAAAAASLAVVVAIRMVELFHYWRRMRIVHVLQSFLAADRCPAFTTDGDCVVNYCNEAAGLRFGECLDHRLSLMLDDLFAAPNAVLARLVETARRRGSASEDRVSRDGHFRLSVFSGGRDLFLWRLEDVLPHQALAAGALDLAVPVAVIGASGRVVAANAALNDLIGRPIPSLETVINDLPLRSGRVHEVASASGALRRRVLEVGGSSGRRELYFLPPNFGGMEGASQLFDTLPVPLLRLATDGEILLANRSARRLLDHAIEPGTRLSDLLCGLGRSVSDWLADAAAGRGLNRSEFLQVSTSERDVFVQVTLKRFIEEGTVRLVAVLNDATELKTLEAQFVQSQKMQAIGQLAGGVAHDFNNLLTAISGHCDLLLLRHDQGDPEYADLVQIRQNANRAASLVGQLLAFSRKQTLQPEVIDLRDTLSELTHLLNRLVGERVQLVLKHDPALPPIRADKRQLEQVIMNLVVNARDAMPAGGEIVIETQTVNLQSEFRRNRASVPAGEYVVVKVSDQGSGIAPDKLPKIFEPFYTTKKTGEGTGLGLSTAYGIVKQTGGFIFADSTPGLGTVFTLYLPTHGAVATNEEPVAKEEECPETGGDGVVLLVEDEAPVRAFASRALRLRGFDVIEAASAEEALERLSNGDLHIDIIVTDVVMPGMDGPTWVRQALEVRPGTRVVFVSGYAEDALDDHRDRIPNSIFLPKPFSLQELTSTVQRQLH